MSKVIVLDDEWDEHLSMCPSQLHRCATVDEVRYVMYLRWRWNDPWDATIIKLAHPDQTMLQGDWQDVYIGYFEHDDYQLAEAALLKYFETHYAGE